jgi:hypothetical protein
MSISILNNSNYTIQEIGSTNIYLIENAFDNDLCDQLIHYINTSKLNKLSFSENNNVECYNVANIEKNYTNTLVISKIKDLFNLISEKKNIKIKGQTLFELRKVYSETRIHKDGVFDTIVETENNTRIKAVRSLTMVITLNDDFDFKAGVYTFPNQNVSIKPKKGAAILFPPYYTHPHGVSCVHDGKFRYICSSWALDDFMIPNGNGNGNDNQKKSWCYKNFFISKK